MAGYNVYFDGAKVNDALVPGPTYTLDGLASVTDCSGRIRATYVNDAGIESDLSSPLPPGTLVTLDYPRGSELSPADQAAVDAIVAASMAESKPPGVVLAITGPRGNYFQAYGNTKASGGRPVTIDDHFRIASTTKSFTSTLVMRSIAAGRLSLDGTLEQYLPGIGIANSSSITIRHMLTMRSGIADYNASPAVLLYLMLTPTGSWNEQTTVNYIRSGKPLFTPGSAYQYNNGNFVLLGLILKAVTGSYIRDLLMDELITPLGLIETTWDVNASGKGSPVVKPPAGGTAQWNPDFLGAAGALTSTVGDLIKWAQAMRDHTRLDAATWAHWTDPDSPTSDFLGYPAPFPAGTPVQFGYGLGLESTGTWFGHNGSWLGYDGQTGFDSVSGACMVILENMQTTTGNGPVPLAAYTTIFRRVAEYLYPGSMTTQPNYKQPTP
ncbi:hypothetical protein BTO20_11535 [Mycobacterium dioxanotrophicus]|uniref:Beta-lactamase-related domain-containing protein n=1 Tax=Mycobacterium dioxanotrophicus TaxID=482462 RepID=A0A1Y0C1R5_9MYCO|nr:serine hydrolase domain-containing protein [Mycobacterium dioxanotrophicus]ART69129.1 hypothetical protein BTO20_11535 [Mycobacterium dioxanotrophicus]